MLLVLAALAGAWMLHRAKHARGELELARAEVDQLRDELHAGKTDDVDRLVAAIKQHASAAHHDTSGILWTVGSWVPLAGNNLDAAHTIAAIVDDLSKHELPGLAASVTAIAPQHLRQAEGQIDLPAIQSAAQQVDTAVPALAKAVKRLNGVPHAHVDSRLNSAHDDLAHSLTTLTADLDGAQRGLTALVPMLGAQGKRTYFVGLQNPSEARGTGGLLGAYAIVTADHGKVTLEHTGPDSELGTPQGNNPVPVPGLPAEFQARWGDLYPTGAWLSSNVSPHLPWTADIWATKYKAQTGTQIDGVLALDPQALTELLGADGSVAVPDGSQVKGSDIPTYVESTLYAKFTDDSAGAGESPERKAYLVALFKGVVDQLIHDPLPAGLLDGLRAGAAEGHIQVWSANAAEEADLEKTQAGGAMPDAPGPFAWLYLLNTTNNKGDYWVTRALTYQAGACPATKAAGATRDSTVTVTLTNTLPLGQPAIVTKRDDLNSGVPYGQTAEVVSVYLPKDAQVLETSGGGTEQGVEVSGERGHTVVVFPIELPRNAPQTVVIRFKEPAAGSLTTWRPQPLFQPEKDVFQVTPCG